MGGARPWQALRLQHRTSFNRDEDGSGELEPGEDDGALPGTHGALHVTAKQPPADIDPGNLQVPLLEDAEDSAGNSWDLSPTARAALGLESSEGSAAGAVARPMPETVSVGGSVASGDADVLPAAPWAALGFDSPAGSAAGAVARPLPEIRTVGSSYTSGDAD